MVVSGVRSSCDTFATKSLRTCSSRRRSVMSWKTRTRPGDCSVPWTSGEAWIWKVRADLFPELAASHPTGGRDHLPQRARDTASDQEAETQREEKRPTERGGEQIAQGAMPPLDLRQGKCHPDEAQEGAVRAAGPDREGQVQQAGADGVAVPDAAPDSIGDGLAHFRAGGMVVHAAQGFAGLVGVPQHKALRIDDGDAGTDCVAQLVGHRVNDGRIRLGSSQRSGKQTSGDAGLGGQPGPQLVQVAGFKGVQGEPAGRPHAYAGDDQVADQHLPLEWQTHRTYSSCSSLSL